ncbi:hypothetical protein K503DRAFT_802381 [Rhizopogon vinicolor AM-OR11-026]|uniref:B30.2/SPRY domain-containing protein n=1 Tax=Rhizopogon vinicolor AM-OR11-026 TaxID=1314800 RepID=A0A1B7MTP2_9AGAM|nr:hypothetical protein K503DRAFT_802381 [Rhizopogon vinicolor AM-OR11-026]
MNWFNHHRHHHGPEHVSQCASPSAPPEWTPAVERSNTYGLLNEASDESYEKAQEFCERYPVESSALLPSQTLSDIANDGCLEWRIQIDNSSHVSVNPGKGGLSRISSRADCPDTCLLSNLPIVAGQYHFPNDGGVYYEITVHKMTDPTKGGVIAIGTACRPYPAWRLPGWNRLSAGLHLDDFHKFFEDSEGGRPCFPGSPPLTSVVGHTIGCGYSFQTGTMFFTIDGQRLPDAFTGIYLQDRREIDVYAAVGVSGECEVSVNFGGTYFQWLEGNEWRWKVDRQVRKLVDDVGEQEELPAYSGY